MSEPFKLTVLEVAKAAYPLFVAGKLQAQVHNVANHPQCYYRHPADKSPCVIGAAIPDDVASLAGAFDNGTVENLIIQGVFDADDEDGLTALQNLHDARRLVDLGDELRRILLSAGEPV